MLGYFLVSMLPVYGEQSMLGVLCQDVYLIGQDLLPYYTTPLRPERSDCRTYAVLLGGTGAMMALDRAGKQAADASTQEGGFPRFMQVASSYGALNGIALALGLTYGAGWACHHDPLRILGREIAETIFLSGTTVTALKYLVGRARPETGQGPFSYHLGNNSYYYHSMPSGHTAVAFSITSVLAAHWQHPLITLTLYSMAATTAFSRMYHDRHWLSDTFFAAGLATLTGWWVVNRDQQRSTFPKWDITLHGKGCSLDYKF